MPKFSDEDKTITLPETIEFESGESIPTDEASIHTVRNEDGIITAINITAELENSGTVMNNLTVNEFTNEAYTRTDLYGGTASDDEDADWYDRQPDYDTEDPISQKTLDQVDVQFNSAD